MRAVRAVRGEAKLSGACGTLFLSLGLLGGVLGSTCVRVRSGGFGVNILCAGTWVLIEFASFLASRVVG